MPRTMFDSITVTGVPFGGDLYAGYIDGNPGWRTWAQLAARFPQRRVVSIAVFATTAAGDVLDVENGDATPAQVPGWLRARRSAGAWPTVYCNLSTWQAVRSAVAAAGVAQPPYWVAHYTEIPHLEPGSVATQWHSGSGYDTSMVADYWPGVDPIPAHLPAPEQEHDMVPKIVNDPISGGFWLVTRDGGVQAFDGAPFPGSLPLHPDWQAGGPTDPVVDADWYSHGAADNQRGLVLVTVDTGGAAHPYHLSRDGQYARP